MRQFGCKLSESGSTPGLVTALSKLSSAATKIRKMNARWVFLIAFALVFYGNGAAFIESFVNYPSWRLIGPAEFTQYHQFISPRILTFLVAPAVLGTVFTMLLLWFKPAAIQTWVVWLAIVLQVIVWVSTITIQVPIQIQLSADGLSAPLIDRLITTNFWLRRIPYLACISVFLWMASTVMRSAAEKPPNSRLHRNRRTRRSRFVQGFGICLTSGGRARPTMKCRFRSRFRIVLSSE